MSVSPMVPSPTYCPPAPPSTSSDCESGTSRLRRSRRSSTNTHGHASSGNSPASSAKRPPESSADERSSYAATPPSVSRFESRPSAANSVLRASCRFGVTSEPCLASVHGDSRVRRVDCRMPSHRRDRPTTPTQAPSSPGRHVP
jgi:hypothetical protein